MAICSARIPIRRIGFCFEKRYTIAPGLVGDPELLFLVAGAFLRVDGKNQHENVQCVSGIPNIDHIGIG